MALRSGHGLGAGKPRVEVLPPDELPQGSPAPAEPVAPENFDERGKFARGNRLSQRGGKARGGQTRLAAKLGLAQIAAGSDFAPYRRAAADFKRQHVATLAKTVGGGKCGSGPASMVASAALQLAASRYCFDRAAETDDPALFAQASRLANDSRQNLLAAHELCAREAKARPRQSPHEALADEFGG